MRYANSSLKKDISGQEVSDKNARSLFSVIKGLEASVRNIQFPELREENNFNQEVFSIQPNTTDFKLESQEIDLTKLEAIKDKIDSLIISYTFRFIILNENINSEEMIDCIKIIREAFSSQNIKPIILTFTTFEYLLRIYNPFIYSQLLDGRMVLFGEDIFLKVKQPDYNYYRKSLLEDTNNIFLFPYKKSLIQWKSIKNFIQNEFESEIKRGLFLKLYLEKSLIEPRYNTCLEECKKTFPLYIQQINELTENHNRKNDDKLSFKTYSLLKTFSSEINNFLS